MKKTKLKYESVYHAILGEVESVLLKAKEKEKLPEGWTAPAWSALKESRTLPEGWEASALMALFPHEAQNANEPFVNFFKHKPDLALEIMRVTRQTSKAWEDDKSNLGRARWFLLQNPWLIRDKKGQFHKFAPGANSRDVPPLFPVRLGNHELKDGDMAVHVDSFTVLDAALVELVFGPLRNMSTEQVKAYKKGFRSAREQIAFPLSPGSRSPKKTRKRGF